MSLLQKAQAELTALEAEAERLVAERQQIDARLTEIEAQTARLRTFLEVARQLDASVSGNVVATDAATAAVVKAGAPAVPQRDADAPTTPNGPFFGLSIRNAVRKLLFMRGCPMSCKNVTEELAAAGFVVAARSLGESVNYALRQLERSGDVVRVDRAHWSLVRQVEAHPAPAPQRDASEHSARTREGLRIARDERGVRLGREKTMTPERIALAKELLAQGVPKTHVARQVGASRSIFYRWMKASGFLSSEADNPAADDDAPGLFTPAKAGRPY